ncbi:hypothetical protein R3P38DRAFT_2955892 [Favolaschia claudopus]|uniref:C3H1-type domain-containing protein n=1 Tax=Favolaschia claudopus TaxID=2862362 RepID=A0AAW0BDK2_9AGAR
MSSRPRLCRFFQEGRCRFGERCHFSHSSEDSRELLFPSNMSGLTAGTSFAGTASISGILSGPGPMLLFGAVRSNPSPVNPSSQLVEAINSLRVSAGQEVLDKSDEFFHVMNKVICLEEGDLEDMIEAIRDALPEDCHTVHNSEEEMDYDDESEDEDEDFGIMDLFSPLKKTTPVYQEPTFSPRQTVRFARNSYSLTDNNRREIFADWDLLENPSTINVQFGPDFHIKDSHIAQFCAHPAICRRIQRFTAGDSDTGCGSGVGEEVFVRFVKLCSTMRVFRLDSFTSLSDASLLTIFEHCPNIEMICLAGNDKVHGNVSGTALKTLASRPYLAPKLKSLSLIDQQTGVQSGVKVLSRARPMLWIYTGDTVGNSMAAQSLGEEEQMFTWLGGKIVGV